MHEGIRSALRARATVYACCRAVSVANCAPAVLRRSEQTCFSSASDDEVGGISRAMRERPYEGAVSVGNRAPAVLSQAGAPLSWTSEGADTSLVCERDALCQAAAR